MIVMNLYLIMENCTILSIGENRLNKITVSLNVNHHRNNQNYMNINDASEKWKFWERQTQ